MTEINPETMEKVEVLKMELVSILLEFMSDMNNEETRAKVVEDFTDHLEASEAYDYTVVCDESNNTPDRVSDLELWVDVAVNFAEDEDYIYIPLRLSPRFVDEE